MKKFEVPDFLKVNLMPYFEYATWLAKKRYDQKKDYPSHKEFNPDYELLGILGEIVYQTQLNEAFNYLIIPKGDDGYDFQYGVDVKTTDETKDGHLIEYQDKPYANVYVAVKVNLSERYGYIYSWIFGTEFAKLATVKNYGNGDRNAIFLEQMKPYYTFPPFIQKLINDSKNIQYVLNKNQEIVLNKFIDISNRK
jgi:hypothetical protein